MNYDNQLNDPNDDYEFDYERDYEDRYGGDYFFSTHSDICCAFGHAGGDYVRKGSSLEDEGSWKELCWILTKTKQNERPSFVFTKSIEALDDVLHLCPYATLVAQTKSRHGPKIISCWIVSHEHDN